MNNDIRKTLYLNDLNCAVCANKIDEKIKKNKEYKNSSFSFVTKKLEFDSNKDIDILITEIQIIVDSIEDGVTVTNKKSKAQFIDCKKDECALESKDSFIKKSFRLVKDNKILSISILFTLFLIILNSTTAINKYLNLSLYLVAYLLIGHKVLLTSLKNIRHGRIFDENFLMSIATIGALVLGEYTEAVMVMLLYEVGEAFEDYAVDKSRDSISSLLKIKSETANLVDGDNIFIVEPETVKVGDILLVKVGEKLPLDGIIISGNTYLDYSALTGESMPLFTDVGSEVLSGSINKSKPIRVRVTKNYTNSTVYKILDLVENATSKKAPTEKFITKFAKYYTPFIVVAAALLAILPPLITGGNWSMWIGRSLIFLVISCPCALVLSVPIGYFAGLGSASRNGILVKGGNYLDALTKIDTYVFDKTGTLTKGNFKVAYTDNTTLELAAKLESYSNHPIANAIVKKYEEIGIVKNDDLTNVEEILGMGIKAIYNGVELKVGNSEFLNLEDNDDSDKTYIYVSLNQELIGHLSIVDEIKPGSISLIEHLKDKNTVMLTGDKLSSAETVRNTLGINKVHSKLLPSDKLDIVSFYKDSGKKVLFVGDGINDAPVLKIADVGIAMGGIGQDAAIEAADIVIMNDDPSKIITLDKIARKTKRIVLQNIWFALGVKALFLILGSFGYVNMYGAVFADTGVALLCVLNSTVRLINIKK